MKKSRILSAILMVIMAVLTLCITSYAADDTQSPKVASISLTPNKSMYSVGEKIKVKITLTDDVALANYEITNNGEKVGKTKTISGTKKEYSDTVTVTAEAGTKNKIVVTVTDKSGKSASQQVLYSAADAPEIEDITLSPKKSKNKYELNESITVTAKFSDGVQLSNYKITHNGKVVNQGNVSGKSGTGTAKIFALEGENTIKVTVVNSAGLESSESVTYTGGPADAKPTLDFKLPKQTFEQGETIKFTVEFNDDVKLKSYTVVHNGKVDDDNVSLSKASQSKTISLKAEAGTSIPIKIVVKDTAGNEASKTVTYTGTKKEAAPEKPVIKLSPQKDKYEEGEKILVTITFEDDTALAKYEFAHGGTSVTKNLSATPKQTVSHEITALSGKKQEIEVTVWDAVGKSAKSTEEYSCSGKDMPPSIVSLSIPQTTYEEGETIKLKVVLEDDVKLKKCIVYQNGESPKTVTMSKDKYDNTISIKAIIGKPVTVKVVAVDSEDQTTEKMITYIGTKVEKAPKAEITLSPSTSKNKYEEDESIIINAVFTDDTALSTYKIYHNDVVVSSSNISGTSKSVSVPIKALVGNIKIKAEVTDAAGKTYTETITYTGGAHDAAPTVSFVLSPDKTVYDENDEITIKATFSDDVALKNFDVWHNGKKNTYTIKNKNDSKNVKINAVAGTSNEIKLVARDTAGNETVVYRYYKAREVDNEPDISITFSPSRESNTYKKGESITVKVKISDDKGISSYKIYHEGTLLDSASNLSGATSKTITETIYAYSGENEISVYVTDIGNNSVDESKKYTGINDSTNPVISNAYLSKPENGSYYVDGEDITFTADISDNYGLAEYRFYHNDTAAKPKKLSNTKSRKVSFTTEAKIGYNSISLEVCDEAGNTVTKTLNYTGNEDVSNKKPTVTISGVHKEYAEGDTISLKLSFSDDKGLKQYIIYHNDQKVKTGEISGKSVTAPDYKITAKPNGQANQSSVIRVEVIDTNDVKTTEYAYYLCVNDVTAPVVEILNMPENPVYSVNQKVTIQVRISDNKMLDRFELRHNGTLLKKGDLDTASTTLDLSFDAIEGTNTIQIDVWDSKENKGFVRKTYQAKSNDNEKPSVTISGLSATEYDAGTVAAISMNFTDNEGLSKFEIRHTGKLVKTIDISGTSASATYEFNVLEGENTIEVIVYDKKGNSSSQTIGYNGFSDSVLPTINIVGRKNFYALDEVISFEVILRDENKLARYEVYHGDDLVMEEANLETTSKVFDVSFNARAGTNSILIKVWDKAGNLAQSSGNYLVRVEEEVSPSAPEQITPVGDPIPNPMSKQVKVSIPTFPITINSETVKTMQAQYPYIVYNDITYFPMTYVGSRFLGLRADWDHASGLIVSKLSLKSEGDNESTKKIGGGTNFGLHDAYTTTGFICVNGKYIDNSAEPYPLINFRDVTYFPLTWRFAVEEFGWSYDFTQAEGLVISSVVN